MRTVLVLSLAAACGGGERQGAPVSRAWPVLGTMMSAAVWGADTTRIAHALDAVRDAVDRPPRALAFDSLRREIRRQTGVTLDAGDVAEGDALDRAALMLAGVADSALLDVGGQFLWVGPRGTERPVGIADPANSLGALATVEMRGGSVSTSSRAGKEGTASVTVLAPSGVAADAWATALLGGVGGLACDSVLALAARVDHSPLSVVCADLAGVRWTSDLDGRVVLPRAAGRPGAPGAPGAPPAPVP